jgi:hypothetical protein
VFHNDCLRSEDCVNATSGECLGRCLSNQQTMNAPAPRISNITNPSAQFIGPMHQAWQRQSTSHLQGPCSCHVEPAAQETI